MFSNDNNLQLRTALEVCILYYARSLQVGYTMEGSSLWDTVRGRVSSRVSGGAEICNRFRMINALCASIRLTNTLPRLTRRPPFKPSRSLATMAHNLPNLVKPTHYDVTLYNFDLEKFTFSGDVTIRSRSPSLQPLYPNTHLPEAILILCVVWKN
jgi:hypothetical protein